jgi:hypothetical protein
MGNLYPKHFVARKTYEAYAASLLASDNHWEANTWDEVCQEPEFVEAWNRAAIAAHAAIHQVMLDAGSYAASN